MHFAIVDIETTGGNPSNSKITDISVLIHDGEKIIDEFSTLVNPEIAIPPFIVRLTGISDQMVINAPTFPEIARKIIEITENCVFVAHNVHFDYSMLRSEFKRLGYTFTRPNLCTVKTARMILPGHESYSLGKIAAKLGIIIQDRHRAKGDALATASLFRLLFLKDQQLLTSQISQQFKASNLHPSFDIESLEEIPNKIGIYKFYNETNQLIYIGKSKHLKKRIEQHLGPVKSKKGAKMKTEITRIEHEILGSELIALLFESLAIKQHKPIYNKKLRNSIYPYAIYDETNSEGYIALRIAPTAKENTIPIQLFQSKKEAETFLHYAVKKHQLCQKIVGLYTTNGPCFGYQIKECNGACINNEPSEKYNDRVQSFIDSLDFSSDSFYIIENGRTRNEKGIIHITNDSYYSLGFINQETYKSHASHWNLHLTKYKQDKDSKQLLLNYLKKNKYVKTIPSNL